MVYTIMYNKFYLKIRTMKICMKFSKRIFFKYMKYACSGLENISYLNYTKITRFSTGIIKFQTKLMDQFITNIITLDSAS